MTINLFELILWVICGVLTFVFSAANKDHKVFILSLNYACCWVALIIQLIAQL